MGFIKQRLPIAVSFMLLTLYGGVASPAFGQESATTDDEEAVLAVINRLFDGMRAADTSMVSSTLSPNTRLITTSEREGAPAMSGITMEQFLTAIAVPHEEEWDEKIWDTEIRIEDNLATAWMRYSFFLGPNFSHCGVNAFQLFRSADGWKIFQIADTRKREDCPPVPD